jgi:hypothetical protein
VLANGTGQTTGIMYFGLGSSSFAQRTITGTVTDAKTGEPVSLVNLVTVSGTIS